MCSWFSQSLAMTMWWRWLVLYMVVHEWLAVGPSVKEAAGAPCGLTLVRVSPWLSDEGIPCHSIFVLMWLLILLGVVVLVVLFFKTLLVSSCCYFWVVNSAIVNLLVLFPSWCSLCINDAWWSVKWLALKVKLLIGRNLYTGSLLFVVVVNW